MIAKAYNRLLRAGGEAWRATKAVWYGAYDRALVFIERIEAETRPETRAAARAARAAPAVASAQEPPRCVASAPDDTRLYAIGDIHGRADLMKRLLDDILADAAGAPETRKALVFLGDYVDRGFQSREVIEHLISADLSPFETHFLKGNHEAAFEMFLSDPDFGPEWARFGGAETLMSYGIQPPRSKTAQGEWGAACEELNAALPVAHRKFLNGLKLYEVFGDYVFVHAGLRPGRGLDSQAERDLLWIREDFLNSDEVFDKLVVHGHTPIGEPHRDHRRIGIDTGAYLTGRLTAACFVRDEVRFLST